MQKFSFLTAILLIFILAANGQNDTLYIMKGGSVINKQSIKQSDLDSIKFNNLDTIAFVKNNLIINKQSIKSSDVDSVVFYKPSLGSLNTVTDFDGNVYNTVTIGTQVWMKENLRTTHYSDGTAIPLVENDTIWSLLTPTSKAFCWYNDSIVYKDLYGGLYTWAAAMNGAASSNYNPSWIQGVCPIGWHLPSDAEWYKLSNYLANNGYNYDGSIGGTAKVAKALASTNGWNNSTVTAAVGNTDYPTYRNKSDFTGLPGGKRLYYGEFSGIGGFGFFWSSAESSTNNAWYRYIPYSGYMFMRDFDGGKDAGYSVRCVKD